MAIVAVAPFGAIDTVAWVIRAEFAEEVERGGFRLGGGYFFRFNSKLARCLSIGLGNGSIHPFFRAKNA